MMMRSDSLRSASAAAIFDPYRLTIARGVSGLTRAELAERVSVSAALISQYELGKTTPSATVLARVALALGFPVEFFAADGVARNGSEDQVFFRSLRSATKRDRDRAFFDTELIADLVRVVEEHVELPDVEIPKLLAADDDELSDIEDRAAEVRRAWNMQQGPVGSVVKLLEAHGAVVYHLHATSSKLDAFSRWMDARPVVVLSQDKNDAGRSRFDASHELGHLVMHPEARAADKVYEAQAHKFAAAFLMPREDILSELPARADWKRFIALKATWGVSIQALLRRARDLEVMTEYSYKRAVVELNRMGWRTDEPGALPVVERPSMLPNAFSLLAAHGITADQIARQARLHGPRVEALFAAQLTSTKPAVTV